MNMIIFMVAMLAAFFVGAYVRKPFNVIAKKQSSRQTETIAEQKKTEYQKSLSNMLAYNGEKQEEYTDED